MTKSDEQWRQELTAEEYAVLRQQGTERAFSGEYWDCHLSGVYHCRGCGEPLFDAEHKFDSGSGWPSFYQPLDKTKITEHSDTSYGMIRTEIVCASCGGHLGHVFTDGPRPTGLRYCVNSLSLRLKAD